MPLITHLLNVEELSRLLKNVALSVINLFILDDVSEKMEYIPDWVVVTRLNIWCANKSGKSHSVECCDSALPRERNCGVLVHSRHHSG